MIKIINKNNSYCSIISIIKIILLHNQKEILIKPVKKIIPILKILWKFNFISNFFFINKNELKIILEQNNINYKFKNIKLYYKSSNYYYISYKKIKKYFSNDYSYLIILSTIKGIITHNDAMKLKIGGKIIFVLY